MSRKILVLVVVPLTATVFYVATGVGQQAAAPPGEAIQEAQTTRQAQSQRPEEQKSSHDQSDIFRGASAPSSSTVLPTQPDEGKMLGFDFARDPLNSKRPHATRRRDHKSRYCRQAAKSPRLSRSYWTSVMT